MSPRKNTDLEIFEDEELEIEENADDEEDEETVDEIEVSEKVETSKSTDTIRYSVKVNGEWVEDMDGLKDPSGEGRSFAGLLGSPITDVAIDGVESFRLCRKHGWSDYIRKYDTSQDETDSVLAIEIDDVDVKCGVHVKGGSWLDTKTMGTDYAGCMIPIDGLWLDRV